MKAIVIKYEDHIWDVRWLKFKRKNKKVGVVFRFYRTIENLPECEKSRTKLCLFIEKRRYGCC